MSDVWFVVCSLSLNTNNDVNNNNGDNNAVKKTTAIILILIIMTKKRFQRATADECLFLVRTRLRSDSSQYK